MPFSFLKQELAFFLKRWGAYTNLTQVFRDPETGKLSQMNNVICGLGAGVCEAVCAVTPVETVKTRVTDDQRRGTGNYKGSADAIVKIMRSEGPMGLYRGAFPTILKQGTNQAVRMPLQVAIFQVISMGDESQKQNPLMRPGCLAYFDAEELNSRALKGLENGDSGGVETPLEEERRGGLLGGLRLRATHPAPGLREVADAG